MAPYTDISTRALIVTLKSPFVGKTAPEIAELTGISARQINRIYARAIERGFDPNQRPFTLRDEWLRDADRSGRPSKQTEDIRHEVLAKVRRDGDGRKRTCADIASELSSSDYAISAATVRRILKTKRKQTTGHLLQEKRME